MRKMYKGFNKDMTCRGFQFQEGCTYTENTAELCKSGFHACENPLDCFSYYDPGKSVFHEVELDATEERNMEDSKRCGKTITVGARLDVAGICKAHFKYVTSRCTPSNNHVAGDKESAAAGEYGSAAAGDCGSAAAGEYGSAAAGYRGSAAVGRFGLACSLGGKVKGGIGAVLAVTESNEAGNCVAAKAVIVDGDTVKADTWYILKCGELVEVTE